MTRKQRILRGIDPRAGKGLEFGPLDRPIIDRGDGEIAYIDLYAPAVLRQRYGGDPTIMCDRIVELDFEQGERSVAETVGAAAPFDYAVASHVLEHIPNPIGWLRDISAVLKPGGKLALVLPDKRFIFDHRRRVTPFDRLIDAYAYALKRATPGLIYDAVANQSRVADAAQLWSGDSLDDRAILDAAADGAFGAALGSHYSDVTVEVHCSVFTPRSFLENLRGMMRHDLIDFELEAFQPTAIGDMEFMVTLRKMPDGPPLEKRARALKSLLADTAAARILTAPEDAVVFSGLPVRYHVADAIHNAVLWLPRRLRRRADGNGRKAARTPPVQNT